MTFRIYKGKEKIVEGESPLELKGIGANQVVKAGTYEATRVEEENESERIAIPEFTTLPIEVTRVTLDKTEITLEAGQSQTVKATVQPSNATEKSVDWSSKDTKVATVSNGDIKGLSAGNTEIVVKTKNGNKTATVKVVVIAKPEPKPEPES